MECLSAKLTNLKRPLIVTRRQTRAIRTRNRDAALLRIEQLDSLEDNRPLGEEEVNERKLYRNIVAEEDLRIEMDMRQRSRQLWLEAGDANTRFFHLAASAR